MYARAVTLHHNGDANGTIVATFETYSNSTPHFPVLESTDGGASWTRISTVVDTVHGYGMRWNPQIYELPERLGSHPAGTLLVAGLSVPRDMSSTHILMYASTDQGRTWRFASSIATGGAAYPLDPFTPVWEPFLLMHDGKLIVFYSDQRENPRYSQKLVHQVSTDGIGWGPIVDDVTFDYQEARPGMPTVAHIGGGRWMLTYEICDTRGGACPVAYRIAGDPETFAAAPGRPLVLDDGREPAGHPYVTWTASGGPNGTIVVSNGAMTPLALNRAGGDPGAWTTDMTEAPSGYSRSLMVMPDGNTVMTLTGGDHESASLNDVEFALDDLARGVASGATYTLTNRHSGLNAGVPSTARGAAVVQLAPAGTPAAQQWVLHRRANGHVTLRNVASGLVLAVRGASTQDGAVVEQAPAVAGASSQEWAVLRQTDGSLLDRQPQERQGPRGAAVGDDAGLGGRPVGVRGRRRSAGPCLSSRSWGRRSTR